MPGPGQVWLPRFPDHPLQRARVHCGPPESPASQGPHATFRHLALTASRASSPRAAIGSWTCVTTAIWTASAHRPLLTASERLLLDNVVIEYRRAQYRILAEETLKATPEERRREERGRQPRPGAREEPSQRSRGSLPDTLRRRWSGEWQLTSLLLKPLILRPKVASVRRSLLMADGLWFRGAARGLDRSQCRE